MEGIFEDILHLVAFGTLELVSDSLSKPSGHLPALKSHSALNMRKYIVEYFAT